jgi:hypothetical protein
MQVHRGYAGNFLLLYGIFFTIVHDRTKVLFVFWAHHKPIGNLDAVLRNCIRNVVTFPNQ